MAHASAARFNEAANQKQQLKRLVEKHDAHTISLRAALAACQLREERFTAPCKPEAVQRRKREEPKKTLSRGL